MAKVRTRIKFCGFVRRQDVRFAASLGVDAMGLVFYERSSRLVSLEQARELRAEMPSWVSAVGLFVNTPIEQVRQYNQALGLDVIQYHGDEDQATCEAAVNPQQAYWKAVRVRNQADLLDSWASFDSAESFLLDAFSPGYGGSGHSFDWSLIPADHHRSLILSGGLDASNVGQAIAQIGPVGVDVSSSIQGQDPREKDPVMMQEFVQAVVAADASLLTNLERSN